MKHERPRSVVDIGQRLVHPRLLVRRARELDAASLGPVGERPPGVEDPGNLAGALTIRSGRKHVLAWGDAPAAGKLRLQRWLSHAVVKSESSFVQVQIHVHLLIKKATVIAVLKTKDKSDRASQE